MCADNHAGDSIYAENANWKFSGEVCKTFDDHVKKSVPYYEEGHDLIMKLADFFLTENSVCYEMGCATGSLIARLAERNSSKNVRIVGLDVENEMLDQAKEKCASYKNVEFLNEDLIDVNIDDADLIISYYTMQFVKPKNRQLVFERIYNSLNWGGAFILFEKVRGADARFQDIMTALYSEYKIEQGYNADEIMAKARSLKGVLEPFSTQGNIDLLKRAGFVDIMSIMKYVCFEGFLAIK